MHFSSTILFTILPLLTTTAPTSSTPSQPPFQILAINSGSPIQYLPFTASNNFIYINKGPPANFTNAGSPHPSSPGKLDLANSIPGGQQVYIIAANKGPETPEAGALAYTPAHSHAIPEGAYTDGFEYRSAGKGEEFGIFAFTQGKEKDSLYACQNDKNRDVYQVFADVEGGRDFISQDCLAFKPVPVPVGFEGPEASGV